MGEKMSDTYLLTHITNPRVVTLIGIPSKIQIYSNRPTLDLSNL